MYRRILLAVDLTSAARLVGQRARSLAEAYGAELHVVHVVEPIPPLATLPLDPAAPALITTQAEMIEVAEEQIGKLAGELDLPKLRWKVLVGHARSEIVRAAADGGMDLIVIGNHGRHGLAALFQPTEGAVVQHAPCDVLAVRLPDEGAGPGGL